MTTEKTISAIPSVSGFDMLESVRTHDAFSDVYGDAFMKPVSGLSADLRATPYAHLPLPEDAAVVAFASLMEADQTRPCPPVELAQELHLTDSMAYGDTVLQARVVTEDAIALPSPETLLAESVRHLQGEKALGQVRPDTEQLTVPIADVPLETSSSSPWITWTYTEPKLEPTAFELGLEQLDGLWSSIVHANLSQRELLELQFAMEEITVYKELGIKILQSSATNLETVLTQSG